MRFRIVLKANKSSIIVHHFPNKSSHAIGPSCSQIKPYQKISACIRISIIKKHIHNTSGSIESSTIDYCCTIGSRESIQCCIVNFFQKNIESRIAP